ncbi:MAG: hypothetical protein EXR53_01195 [Dehalococcoidia bacterium]|nr:hypothetical protein [Dehalococcoidia bacterium]
MHICRLQRRLYTQIPTRHRRRQYDWKRSALGPMVSALACLLIVSCREGKYTPTPYPTYTPLPTYTPYPSPIVSLTIVDDFFQDSAIVVVKGTKVVWVNAGENVHSATYQQDGEQWDTGLLMPGQSGVHVFNKTGNYFYFCKVHEYMIGSIRVLQ